MFNVISFERLLGRTVKDLADIKENLGVVYGDRNATPEIRRVALADAFNTIDEWSNYFSRFKKILDDRTEQLNNENVELKSRIKYLENRVVELDNELEIAKDKNNKHHGKIGRLQSELEQLNKSMESKDDNIGLVPVELASMIEKLEDIANSYKEAIKAAEHKAAMKTFNQRVASGEVKPAKRVDVDDKYIAYMYKEKGLSSYKISKLVGMTPQAITYRVNKLKEQGLLDVLAEEYKKEKEDV